MLTSVTVIYSVYHAHRRTDLDHASRTSHARIEPARQQRLDLRIESASVRLSQRRRGASRVGVWHTYENVKVQRLSETSCTTHAVPTITSNGLARRRRLLRFEVDGITHKRPVMPSRFILIRCDDHNKYHARCSYSRESVTSLIIETLYQKNLT
jgi:hypothetical protein